MAVPRRETAKASGGGAAPQPRLTKWNSCGFSSDLRRSQEVALTLVPEPSGRLPGRGNSLSCGESYNLRLMSVGRPKQEILRGEGACGQGLEAAFDIPCQCLALF